MAEPSIHARRREAYMQAMGPGAVALIGSPRHALRNGDAHYAYRPSSDLYYLTGLTEPEVSLVLRPGHEAPVVLFLRPRDPERETWDGRRTGLEGAKDRHGADLAFPAAELRRRLPELVANHVDLYYGVGVDLELDAIVSQVIAELRAAERRGLRPPRRIVDPRAVLHEQRLHKSADEVATLRRAAEVSAEAHLAAMRAGRPGATEFELEAIINYTFRRRGGAGPGYNTIVGSGPNATILHYVENDRAVADGDLVLIDAGCEVDCYTADITRTWPASGRFTPSQRRVYEIVLAAQEQAIALTRPGVTLEALHGRCVEVLTQGMVDLGLLAGPAAARIDDASYKRFYMHRTSHWLGLDVHDVGAYVDAEGGARPLAAGMVITIEPGLYVAADAEAPAELRGIGVRIEDDLLVTANGHEILTAATPKQVADVEAACAR